MHLDFCTTVKCAKGMSTLYRELEKSLPHFWKENKSLICKTAGWTERIDRTQEWLNVYLRSSTSTHPGILQRLTQRQWLPSTWTPQFWRKTKKKKNWKGQQRWLRPETNYRLHVPKRQEEGSWSEERRDSGQFMIYLLEENSSQLCNQSHQTLTDKLPGYVNLPPTFCQSSRCIADSP